MRLWDLIGYVAAALVLAAFYMREIFPSHSRETAPLRMTAMCGNLAFIVYGLTHDLIQVWLLHALLLPMNGLRLLEALHLGVVVAASRRAQSLRSHPIDGSGMVRSYRKRLARRPPRVLTPRDVRGGRRPGVDGKDVEP